MATSVPSPGPPMARGFTRAENIKTLNTVNPVRLWDQESRGKGRDVAVALQRMSPLLGVRREKAALSSGCKSHPATAPAGSNRSSHGGNEVAEAFG